jgi:hypothetical protein
MSSQSSSTHRPHLPRRFGPPELRRRPPPVHRPRRRLTGNLTR